MKNEDSKLHMVSINGQARFVRYPKGIRPYVSFEDLDRLFEIKPGQCIRVG